MKKVLFPSIALVLVLGLALMAPLFSFIFPVGSALAAEDDPYVCLVGYGPGKSANLTPYSPPDIALGLFYLTVDGQDHEGWCIEPGEALSMMCFNATLSDAPRESPWCEIAYIVTNNSPSTNNTAAAMQLAIWKYLDGGRENVYAPDDADLENAALAMYDAAFGKSVNGCNSTLELEAEGEATEENGVASQDFTATVTDSSCLEGIAIEFSTNNGSFSSTGTVTAKTVITDSNGKASVTLYWDTSDYSFAATVTAHTEGNWPVKIDPEQEGIQQTISMSRHCELTDQVTIGSHRVGGDVSPVNKFGVLAPWIGLALVLVGSMIWFALKRRSRQQEVI